MYRSGNLKDTNKDGDHHDTSSADSNFSSIGAQSQAYDVGIGVTLSADDAFENVLRYMGALWWQRDYQLGSGNTQAIGSVDERLIHETFTGSGRITAWADNPFNDYPHPFDDSDESVPPSIYASGYQPYDPSEGAEWRQLLALRADPATGEAPFNRPAGWDEDGDGMPNYWEIEHGLDPTIPGNNADFDLDGYTDLEEYINDVAAWPAPGPIIFGGASSRYAEIQNWRVSGVTLDIQSRGNVTTSSLWQPSRYDEAQINSGVAVVDAVGQHAGAVKIADSATLTVSAGWLKVDDANEGLSSGAISIGDAEADAATLNLSGGELFAQQLSKSESSDFLFTGGKLHADQINFDLQVAGGAVAPGRSIGVSQVLGNASFALSSSLEVEILGIDSDQLIVTGDLDLGIDTALDILNLGAPSSGTYAVAQYAGSLSGQFVSVTPGYSIDYSVPGEIRVSIIAAGVQGDFNSDGFVDAADYTAWRDQLGMSSTLHGNGDETGQSEGVVDLADYEVWRLAFGQSALGASQATVEAVPEPTAGLLLLCCLLLGGSTHRSTFQSSIKKSRRPARQRFWNFGPIDTLHKTR